METIVNIAYLMHCINWIIERKMAKETVFNFRPRNCNDATYHVIHKFLDENELTMSALFNSLLPHIKTAIDTTADLNRDNEVTITFNLGTIIIK